MRNFPHKSGGVQVSLARLADLAGPLAIGLGLLGLVTVLALGLLAGWTLTYPWNLTILLSSGLAGAGLAWMFLQAHDHRVRFADGEEE
jgi:hypothetical protein